METRSFSPETIDFLWGIRLNNDRDWFQAHKEDYLRTLYEPMKELGAMLREAFSDEPGLLCKVSRIYRDLRIPRPGGPYKESLWISLRPDGYYWAEQPCLYFEIRPEGGEYGFALCRPRSEFLEAFRQELRAGPDRFLALAEAAERETGMRLHGEEYKRRKPCEDPRTERFMSCKNLFCERAVPVGEALFSPELGGQVRDTLRRLLPLYRYFLHFT